MEYLSILRKIESVKVTQRIDKKPHYNTLDLTFVGDTKLVIHFDDLSHIMALGLKIKDLADKEEIKSKNRRMKEWIKK